MDELTLQVSGIIEKDGRKQACVRFSARGCYAEGYIPDCVLTKCEGFDREEQAQLIAYLREHLDELKKRAARVSPLGAILGKH